MDLIAFHYDRNFVLDALRQGEIDYLEHVSEAAEADFFRHLIRRQVVQRLAETYPTPRKNSDERDPSYLIVALRVDFRSVLRDHDLRRHLNQRLEPAESAGETDAGVVTGRHTATNRDGLEHCWPDLLVHPEKHESPIRPDGASVHRRLDPAEGVQVRSECRRRLRFRRNCPGIPGARGPQQAGFVRIEHRPSGAATD